MLHHPTRSETRAAFTLVELLVVIGIIALLISVLLPALGKARQAGNLVDCQARLQQMGQAMNNYVSSNKGLLPWGVIDRPAGWNADKETTWWWFFTLSEYMNKNLVSPDGYVHNLSPTFRDRDTIDPPDNGGTFVDENNVLHQFFWVNHYTSNPRVLYNAHDQDNAPTIFSGGSQPAIQPSQRTQRKIGSVRRPSNVFVLWDGPQVQNQGYNVYGSAASMDGWAMDSATAFCFEVPNPNIVYDRASPPGQFASAGRTDGRALQRKYNRDIRNMFTNDGPDGWTTHMRFRHMNNTTLAALCLDGHVETRKVGEFKIKDYYTNYK
jgi:prepilin-type N-terminal cleavage/methylation domain-containing protein